MTSDQSLNSPDTVDRAQKDGYRVIPIPENIAGKIRGEVDVSGNPMVDVEHYNRQWNESFRFEFIEADQLSTTERAVYGLTDAITQCLGGRPQAVCEIRISETMRLEHGFEVAGVFEPREGRIVIKRSQLQSIRAYAGTLLHELIHAQGGHGDVSREFESDLTDALGRLASTMVQATDPTKDAPIPEMLRTHSQTIAEPHRSRQRHPES